MREIVFRGKRKVDGTWVYGALLHRQTGGCYIAEENGMEDEYTFHDVIPQSIGQYVGLCDKNGQRIFEGDIAKHERRVEFVTYHGGGFSPFAIPGWEVTPKGQKVTVIGNASDNPELAENLIEK